MVGDSPAEDAGLQEDDIIYQIDGANISGTGDLYRAVRSHKPGDRISVAYIRNGKHDKVEIELGESKNDYFLGSLDAANILPKLKVNNKIKLPDSGNLQKQMDSLKDELEKLRSEFEHLKDGLKE